RALPDLRHGLRKIELRDLLRRVGGDLQLLRPAFKNGASDIDHQPRELGREGILYVARHMDLDGVRLLVLHARNEHGIEEAARGVVQRLPAQEVIDGRPAGDLPAVIELPIQRAHAARLVLPPMLDGVLDRETLEYLRKPYSVL